MGATSIALIGIGKIARDQHIPVITANPDFELLAAVSPDHRLDGVRNYSTVDLMLEQMPDLQAVAICTPPQVRYEIARRALRHGCHVLLEKPPAGTLNEAHALIDVARQSGVSLFAAWHSREAAGVAPAREWLAKRSVQRVSVRWKEDVRVWHPGQAWIWRAGGLGVFDPGINAVSILTCILPGRLLLREAELAFPSNCETPIRADLQLATSEGAGVSMQLDFLHTGPPMWDIEVETDDGQLQLSKGGSVLRINGVTELSSGDFEYSRLYQHFATLLSERRVDVDLRPLELVADAFLCGRHVAVAPFRQ